jgi:hypothetical protein
MNPHCMFSCREAWNEAAAALPFSNRGDEPRRYWLEKLDISVGVAVGAREQDTP